MNVLFVCTGNVCRSPMAEGFLRHEADRLGLDLDVRSTGTHAWAGRAATWEGRRIMQELGVPIDEHRTLELDPALVDWADLVIGLAREHIRGVVRDHPEAEAKTFGLKELIHLLPSLPPLHEPDDLIHEAHRARGNAAPLDDTDVDDPFGEREEAYRRVATEIRELITALAEGLDGKLTGSRA